MNKIIKSYKPGLIILAYIVFMLVIWYAVSSWLVDKQQVRTIVGEYGFFGPGVFVLIQALQNIFAPIAHYPILLAGGFIFGPWLGMLYNWIGTTLGTIVVVWLARKFGRPLITKMVNKEFIKKYDKFAQKLSPYGLFLIYALPVFPDDEISYLMGLSNMRLTDMYIAIILGKIGGASLAWVGDEFVNGAMYSIIINVAVLVIGTMYYFRNKIKSLFLSKKK